MTLRTWLGFLIGRADCIERAAKSRGVLTLGLLFVLSAGLAREYDQEDLLHEPWHALLPLIVSLVTSFLLYCLIQLFTSPPPGETRRFWLGYRSFLGLYWLMAPMAWLYAFPVERFGNEYEAVRVNLCLLLIVSVWRVVLMTRIIQILWRAAPFAALLIVGWFSLSIAIAALAYAPTPVLSMMGGVRMSAAERLIAEISFLLQALFSLAWLPVLLAVILVWFFASRFRRPNWLPSESAPSASLWMLGGVSVAAFAACLPFAQPEQLRRTQAESLLRAGRIQAGLDYIAEQGIENFPPFWDPPPRVTYAGRQLPDIGAIIERHLARPLPENLEAVYLKKLLNAIGNEATSVEDRKRYVRLLARTPGALELLSAGRYRESMQYALYTLPENSPEHQAFARLLDESARHEQGD